jgi:hypothetical protein
MAKYRGMLEFDYILIADRELPVSSQTVFRLKRLTRKERELIGQIEYEVDQKGNRSFRSNPFERARKLLNFGLLGWSNFDAQDANGKPIEFREVQEGDRRWLPDQILECVGEDSIELANAITEGAEVSQELAKN